jgi:hypothetical protein
VLSKRIETATLTHGQPFSEIVELMNEMWLRRDAIVALRALERVPCLEARNTDRIEQLREHEYCYLDQS